MKRFFKALKWLSGHDASYFHALLGESTLGLMFVLYALIARILGPDQNGVFTAAVSLGGILAVFIQFGLPALLTRETAGNPVEASRNTLLFLAIQVLHTLPILISLPLILNFLGFAREGRIVCYIIIFAELLRSAKMLWRGIMKGRGWFHMEAVSAGLERLFVVVCAGAVLFWTRSLIPVVAALVLARLIDNIGIGYYLSRKMKIWSEIRKSNIKMIYAKAYPFALHGLLWVLYYQVDIIMLKAMAPAEETGYYGAAFRIMEIFAALPRVVSYVAFTRFAESHARNPEKLPQLAYQTARMLLFFVLPALVAAGYAQPVMIRMIFGADYLPAILLTAVLLSSLSVKMFSTLSEEFLLATGREKKLIPLMFMVTGSNILLNLVLIPRYSALGAAIATGITECIYCALGMNLIIRHGLRQTGRRLAGVAIPCVLLVISPSLLIAGYPPWTALWISAPCVLLIIFFMAKLLPRR